MAAASRVTVNTGAAQLLVANASGGRQRLFITNRGTVVVSVGGDTAVTTANGHDLAAGQTLGPVSLENGDELYAATGTNGQVVHILQT